MDKIMNVSSLTVIRQLWTAAGLPASILENTIAAKMLSLPNDPGHGAQSIRSSFPISAVAQGTIAATALTHHLYQALIKLAEPRTGLSADQAEQRISQLVLPAVSVDARHAVLEYKGWTSVCSSSIASDASENSTIGQMLDNSKPASDPESKRLLDIPEDAVSEWDSLAGLYRTKSQGRQGRTLDMVRIHTNFPHHKLGILQLLSLAPARIDWRDKEAVTLFQQVTRDVVQDKLRNWTAEEFETEAQKRKLCVTAYRSDTQWNETEMGKAVKKWVAENDGMPFRISRLTCAPASDTPIPSRKRTRGALQVVDMSRVIAGPTATRALAAHGAKVLLLSNPTLPNLPITELDTARGKHTAHVILQDNRPSKELTTLLRDCDVFSQAYRPNGLVERGLSPHELQKMNPGIVYLDLRAFGFTGPWSERRGFDSLTQTACGLNFLESTSFCQYANKIGETVEPKAFPVQALDYTAGFLMSFTALACKCRGLLEALQCTELAQPVQGWHVEISLASTAEWIKSLGRVVGAEAWQHPPDDIIPSSTSKLEPYVEAYRVRGVEECSFVLAIRHAAATHEPEKSVPSHLNVDPIAWW